MNYDTCPDRWVIIKLPDCYKVFGTWIGGYLDGDAWRVNSGITEVQEDEKYFYFHGHSGSIYRCHKNSYGTNTYTQGVLDLMFRKAKEQSDVEIETLNKDFDFINLLK